MGTNGGKGDERGEAPVLHISDLRVHSLKRHLEWALSLTHKLIEEYNAPIGEYRTE